MGYSYIKNDWIDYNKDISIDDQRNAIVTVGKLNKMEQGIATPTIEYIDSKAKFGQVTSGVVNDDLTNGTRSIDITYKDTINDSKPSKVGSYSAQYIKDVFDTANNILTKLNNASGGYSNLNARLSTIESSLDSTKYKKYGITFSSNSIIMEATRSYNAVGLIANIGTDQNDAYNDFDAIYPWRDIRRCKGYPTTTNNFKVIAYESDHNYEDEDYDVWVEIPKFYYYMSSTEIIISQYQINSDYNLPSKFKLGDGRELDKVYIAAYNLSYFNNKAHSKPNTPPITTENTAEYREAYYNGEQQFGSIMDKSWGALYNICTNMGPQYSGLTIEDYHIIYLLASVEFATKDLSSVMKGAITLEREEVILSNFGNVEYSIDDNTITMNASAANKFLSLSNGLVNSLIDNHEKYFTIKMKIKEATELEDDDGNTQSIISYNTFYRTIIDYTKRDDGSYIFTFSKNIKDFVSLDGCVTLSYINNGNDIKSVFLFDENVSLSLDVYSNGCTDNIITPSGSIIDNTSGHYPCRYRYIENPWGNQRSALYQVKGNKEGATLKYLYKRDISEDISTDSDETNTYMTTIYNTCNCRMSNGKTPMILPTSTGSGAYINIDTTNISGPEQLPIYVGVDIGSDIDSIGFTTFCIGNIPGTTDDDNINNAISTRLSYICK